MFIFIESKWTRPGRGYDQVCRITDVHGVIIEKLPEAMVYAKSVIHDRGWAITAVSANSNGVYYRCTTVLDQYELEVKRVAPPGTKLPTSKGEK